MGDALLHVQEYVGGDVVAVVPIIALGHAVAVAADVEIVTNIVRFYKYGTGCTSNKKLAGRFC